MDWKTRLIQTASELAARLEDVWRNPSANRGEGYGYDLCLFMANAPCHKSESGTAFVFGDDPNGGVIIRCRSCGRGTTQAVEDALRVRIQRQRMDGGGLLYWVDGKPPNAGISRRRQPSKPDAHDPLRAQQLADKLTLFGVRRWFLADGRKPATFTWRGRLSGFRQSLPLANGGAAACADRQAVQNANSGLGDAFRGFAFARASRLGRRGIMG